MKKQLVIGNCIKRHEMISFMSFLLPKRKEALSKAAGKEFDFDTEESYNVKCLVDCLELEMVL